MLRQPIVVGDEERVQRRSKGPDPLPEIEAELAVIDKILGIVRDDQTVSHGEVEEEDAVRLNASRGGAGQSRARPGRTYGACGPFITFSGDWPCTGI